MNLFIKTTFFIFNIMIICNGQNLTVQNPSFEGPIGAGITPTPWNICMIDQTPDTQPGAFNGILWPTASHGNTYLGLVHTPEYLMNGVMVNWQEGVTQELIHETSLLSQPMESGVTYNFTIDLMGFGWPDIELETNGNAELLIYGGFFTCSQNELLWSSGNTLDFTWTTYDVEFTPSNNYTHIMLQVNSVDGLINYLLVDNMTTIMPQSQCQIISIENTQGSCSNNEGFIETTILDPLDSTPPYTYHWANGSNTQNIYDLSPGIYNLEVIDSDGDCISFLSQEIPHIDNPDISASINQPSCYSDSDGSINIQISGGNEPLTYLWNTGATSKNISNLIAGTYTLTITDSEGCHFYSNYTMHDPPIISIELQPTSFTELDCLSDEYGNIDIQANGGTLDTHNEYTYLWTTTNSLVPIGTSQNINGLIAGSYTVTVTDENGCLTTKNFIINSNCPPKIPNILTLNNDANNDLFIISFSSISLYSESILTIYNRWGKTLYTSSRYGLNGKWWDGKISNTNKLVNSGTYYYILELFHKSKNEKETHSGYIQIINDM